MIRKIYNILAIPALLIHECSHMIMIVLLGAKGDGFEINKSETHVSFEVHYKTGKNYKKNLISIAPLLSYLGILCALYFSEGQTPIILSIYTILFFKVFLPSYEDLKTLKEKIDNGNDEIPEYKKSNL